MNMSWKCQSWPTHFPAHILFSVSILSNGAATYRVFWMTHSSWWSLLNGYMCLYSRIWARLSDQQSGHSFSPTTWGKVEFTLSTFAASAHSVRCRYALLLGAAWVIFLCSFSALGVHCIGTVWLYLSDLGASAYYNIVR